MPRHNSIFLVTYDGEPQLTEDDDLLRRAIEKLGVAATPVCWNDPDVKWHEADLAIVRSTWDYILHPNDFNDWVHYASSQTEVINDKQLLLWNMDKHYLLELSSMGVPTVPTLVAEKGSDSARSLSIALSKYNSPIVIKPTVSCGSHLTKGFSVKSEHDKLSALTHLETIFEHSDALIQPLLEEVFYGGEHSLVFFNDQYSHAAPKEPFRAGLTPTYPPAALTSRPEEIFFAQNVLSKLSIAPLYARVDVIVRNGYSVLNELELIEPELHFRLEPNSANRFAASLVQRAKSKA